MDGCRRDLRIVGGHLKRGRKVGIRRGEIGSTLRKLMTSDSNGEKRRPCAGGTMNGAIDGRPSFLRICRGDFAHNSRWIQAKIPSLCPPIPYLIRSIPCHVFCLRAKRRTSFVSIIDACITDNARLMLTTNVARSILTRPLKPDAFDVVHYFPLSTTLCFLPLVSCQTSSVSFLTYFFPSVRPILEQSGSYLVSRGWQCLAPAVPIELRAVSVIAQETDFHD